LHDEEPPAIAEKIAPLILYPCSFGELENPDRLLLYKNENLVELGERGGIIKKGWVQSPRELEVMKWTTHSAGER
jgi:hypothetical protein